MISSDRLTLGEAATHLKKSPSWLYRNRERLGILGYKVGGCWQFYRDDLDTYIQSTANGLEVPRPSNRSGNNKVILVVR